MGNLIAPELMGHVAIPHKWKEFLFHRGCSFDVTSILKTRLIAGGRERKEGRPIKTRKWKNTQDAINWVNLARAQEKRLRFWQTRSNAVIVFNSVPADCIYKGQRTLFETFRRLRVLGNRSSSNSSRTKTSLRVRLPGNWYRECRERKKVTQQITQNCPGNWSGVLGHLLRRQSLNLKSTSDSKKLHKM